MYLLRKITDPIRGQAEKSYTINLAMPALAVLKLILRDGQGTATCL